MLNKFKEKFIEIFKEFWKHPQGRQLIIEKGAEAFEIIANAFENWLSTEKVEEAKIKIREIEKLDLKEILNGVEKRVKVKRLVKAEGVTYKTCSTCNGQGAVTRISNTIRSKTTQIAHTLSWTNRLHSTLSWSSILHAFH